MKRSFWVSCILAGYVVIRVGSTLFPSIGAYVDPYYTEGIYKDFERVFNESQYRKTKDPAIIPDQTVFSYAAGAYLHGVDPILVNSETTPLGKYFIAASISILKNDKFVAIPFGLVTLVSLFLLGKRIFRSTAWALVPIAVFSSDTLFLNQLTTAPLLDIIQLPFILLSLYVFIVEYPKQRFMFTALCLGLVMATKTHFPAFLLCITFVLFLIFQKRISSVWRLFLWLPVSLGVLVVSYTRTFLDGYSFISFLGFQKWIILYQKSKLLFPFSVWRLVFFNQWQTWWGNMDVIPADDWQITWAIGTGLSLILIYFILKKKLQVSPYLFVLVWWVLLYGLFLSLGVVSSRFLLPFLPVAYILGTQAVRSFLGRHI